MIKSIHIRNFESHEDTLLDGLSPRFNLIVGESQVGKSAILRALKLLAYNRFSPKSVRIGTACCEVEVETERGKVRVLRGAKRNQWEISDVGGQTKVLDKVGAKSVPEAEAVLGMGMVRLGDVDVPVNIMDQMEAHFLLAGVGDEDVSGSLRAQIVDEISGLSGAEELIKSVSLDVHRLGRSIKEAEDKAASLRGQMHDEGALKAERAVLERASELMDAAQGLRDSAAVARDLATRWRAGAEAASEAEAVLRAMPDIAVVRATIEHESRILAEVAAAREMGAAHATLALRVQECEGESVLRRDVAVAGAAIDAAHAALRKCVEIDDFLLRWNTEQKAALISEGEAALFGDVDDAKRLIDGAVEAASKLSVVLDLLESRYALSARMIALEAEAAEVSGKITETREEELAVRKSFDLCPVTLRPMPEACKMGIAEGEE